MKCQNDYLDHMLPAAADAYQIQVNIEKTKAAVASFRGKGKGGAVERLLEDRRADRERKE